MYHDELVVGQVARFTKTITEADLAMFTAITGDFNPIHVDAVAAASTSFGSRIVHGLLTASLLCSVYGMQLPGQGAIQLDQQLRFTAPVRIGDTITAEVEVAEILERCRVRVKSRCIRQDGVTVVEGSALLIALARPERLDPSATEPQRAA